jgi:phenylacetic acid degradation operon negative regulatory protein
MGGAAITAGLYVQALDWDDDVMGIAKRLDIVDNVVMATTGVLRVGHTSDPRQVAARLWPLDALADSYRSFVHDHAVQEPLIDDPVAQLAVSIAITAAFEECIRLDPLLPPELLPSPWAGTQARGVLRNRTKDLVAARRQTGHPALFARYDQLFDSLG